MLPEGNGRRKEHLRLRVCVLVLSASVVLLPRVSALVAYVRTRSFYDTATARAKHLLNG